MKLIRAMLCFALFVAIAACSQSEQTSELEPLAITTYQASNAIFANPERGWFWPYNPECCTTDIPHPPLLASELRALRTSPERITLIRDLVQLGMFMNADISQERLNQIEADWNEARKAGVKVIVRFLYDYSINNRDPKEAIINRHIEQLKPLLERNKDVIAFVEAGLFGGSGEANASNNGYVFDDPNSGGWQRLSPAGKRIYLKLLAAIPEDRMMTLRYPRLKWDLLGWDSNTATPLTVSTAYNQTNRARLGYYNDGFMGDENSYAFLQLPNEKEFLEADAAFVPMTGEPSDNSDYKLQPRQVITDMARFSQTSLNRNSTDALETYQTWKDNGDFNTITRRMGYRFQLVRSSIPTSVYKNSNLVMSFDIQNVGFGSLYNPRRLELILRNKTTRQVFKIILNSGTLTPTNQNLDPRFWQPATTTRVSINRPLPSSIPVGNYDVLLNFPDSTSNLRNRPEYSVRLANQNVWEATTGYNSLLRSIKVNP